MNHSRKRRESGTDERVDVGRKERKERGQCWYKGVKS